jgi:hypothetical protein
MQALFASVESYLSLLAIECKHMWHYTYMCHLDFISFDSHLDNCTKSTLICIELDARIP